MKNLFSTLAAAALLLAGLQASAQNTIPVFDTVLYFDGYASTVSAPAPPAGVIRHRNDLYARMLTPAELQMVGTTLTMKVVIKAACDNYDRIGSVSLALVPKGAATYHPDSVEHLELGRFITPFMNKNNQPDTVPYVFNIDNVAALLKESSLSASYDFWVELEVFGVPYAANTEVVGCAGRSDVFYGSLDFITNTPAAAQTGNVLELLAFKESFNNYQAAATDTLGKTTKTISFTAAEALSDATLYLITSNHGANSGGEEYNRRIHYVYFDGAFIHSYKPGSTSCEPLRVYNTQGNGIYGPNPRTDAQWQSFSNWCPGDTIPIRKIHLGAVAAGSHSFKITVPAATFNAGQGNFPLSLYLQGKAAGSASVAEATGRKYGIAVYPNPASDRILLEHPTDVDVYGVSIVNVLGEVVYQQNGAVATSATLPVAHLACGTYVVRIQTAKGVVVQQLRIVK